MSEAAQDGGVFFDAVLAPHRSLSPRGFLVIMLVFGAASFASGLFFVAHGAWPVCGFFGLDVLLVYVAFKANYRAGRAFERVKLTEADLTVRRVSAKGADETHRFEPAWVRVEMDDPPEHGTPLIVASHGRRLGIGAFLTVEERVSLGTGLRRALAERRRALIRRA